MDASRAEKIAGALKTFTDLGKSIKMPVNLKYQIPAAGDGRLPPPVQGSSGMRILLYVVVGLITIGLILLGVDQWITPIFQRTPGGSGYIPVPGTDTTELFFKDASGSLVPVLIGGTSSPKREVSQALEKPPLYSITLDVLINKETSIFYNSNGLSTINRHILLIATPFGPPSDPLDKPTSPMHENLINQNKSLSIMLDATNNTVIVSLYSDNAVTNSMLLKNVPLHIPFRIGVSVNTNTNVMNGYLNGLLVDVKTINTVSAINLPKTGDVVYPAGTLQANTVAAGGQPIWSSQGDGISVLNMRTFRYIASPSEMMGRMGDLAKTASFAPYTAQ